MIHQKMTTTAINRYPDIFKFCYDNRKKYNCKILSFGSSSGEELVTLAMFFGNSEIFGVELDEDSIKTAKKNTKNVERINISNNIPDEKFDIIFCMSVLCRWPETASINDTSNIYNFNQFENIIIKLDDKLNKDGFIVIYNSNFLFEDTEVSKRYKSVGEFTESGFVHKFTKENKKTNIEYKNCVFQKLID